MLLQNQNIPATAYKIVAVCNSNTQIPLAGFVATEQAEAMVLRHLQNMCKQSNGSLLGIQQLLQPVLNQWASTLSIPAMQQLQTVHYNQTALHLQALMVYAADKLINKIVM
jgi:hypothetical protein